MKTFSNYQYRRLLTKEGSICHGDYVKDDFIIRTKNGFLNDVLDEEGSLLPAIQMHDGSHIEHWKNGVLHCEDGPAVEDLFENRKEWWIDGKKIKVYEGAKNGNE